MRALVRFEPDVEKAITRRRRHSGDSVSHVVNELIRAGLVASSRSGEFTSIPRDLGLCADVSNIGEALDVLEGPKTK